MTEQAREALAELLDDNETIADASTWADEHRVASYRRPPPGTTWTSLLGRAPPMTPSGQQTIPRRAAWSTRSTSSGRW